MLAIWSRARQRPGTCRYITSVSNATAVARRHGQSGLRGAWAFRTPTSTFCYTTIFAAGLTIDAHAKAARSKQWEEAFENLRDALDRPLPKDNVIDKDVVGPRCEQVNLPHGYHGVPLEDLPDELDWGVIQRAVGMELVDDPVLRQQETQSQIHDLVQGYWDDLRFDSRLPGAQVLEWPANTGQELVRYHLPPQSLWAPDTLRLTAMRRRHTWKKLALQELSTGGLIHTLISRINLPRYFRSASSELEKLSSQLLEIASLTEHQASKARQEILDNIEKLHQTDVKRTADDKAGASIRVDQPGIPSYFQDVDGDFYDICQQMNKGIKQLFDQVPRGNDREEALAIAKICHNLLVSTASPDLQTFNILLAGFKRLRRPNLVDDVIAAFYVHKIRPNEITCREILGYYISELRADDFSRFVARMRGVGDALMLANPSITLNEAGHNRLVRISENKVYQKVHPTPMVFGALIGGVMKFAGFDRALDIYYEMKADGWGLDMQGLTRLLGDCIRRADWEGGVYTWEEISGIKAKAKPKDMVKAYYYMLSLCSVTGNTVAFNQVLNEIAKRGFDRKSIINAAIRTTDWARKNKNDLAPAWAADNVLIAVSDYVHDARLSTAGSEIEEVANDDDMFVQHNPSSSDTFEEGAVGQTERNPPVDSREAWASWVEHEFGERPKDPES
ncbi:Nn.00g015780.m01.CDS01 [Neocucurbitaria sp. VM-36]